MYDIACENIRSSLLFVYDIGDEFFSDFLNWDPHGLLSLVFSVRLISQVIIEETTGLLKKKFESN